MPALPRPHHLLLAGLLPLLVLLAALPAPAQPTYKLDVKPNLKPLATLKLEAGKFARSEVKDDPGFRLQYHFKKDGKTLALVEGRAQAQVGPPALAAGTYTVVLELFYPNYKGGSGPKGVYRPISNVLTYRVAAGPPAVVTVVEPAPKR